MTKATLSPHMELSCACRKIPQTEGFYTCDKNGNHLEPDIDSPWDSDYRCEDCGRVWHVEGWDVTELVIEIGTDWYSCETSPKQGEPKISE